MTVLSFMLYAAHAHLRITSDDSLHEPLSRGLHVVQHAVQEQRPDEDHCAQDIFAKISQKDLTNVTFLRDQLIEDSGQDQYIHAQDLVERFVTGRKPRVLEVGANNGVMADNLFPIIFAHEWEGTLMEPVPELFAELQKNYARKSGDLWSGLHLLNVAVTEKSGPITFTVPNEVFDGQRGGREHPCWKGGVGHIGGWRSGHTDIDRETNMKNITVTGGPLANHLNFDSYDVVQIDVEKYDSQVVTQLAALPWTPLLICVETCDAPCRSYYRDRGLEEFSVPGNVCGLDPRLK